MYNTYDISFPCIRLFPSLELCEHHVRLCTCRSAGAARRELAVFRTCSGTLRLKTINHKQGTTVKQCACLDKQNNKLKTAFGIIYIAVKVNYELNFKVKLF
ncbi:unnamed protein product [Diatraea saccharalis]|uniref:Uncharacterized protein n=1 Tax=Diatraea saccharalis TaxID=40085 RepID=A0A9N9RHI6_9NEOP|nr:unnamed protein product [Diatraea saccharalis]